MKWIVAGGLRLALLSRFSYFDEDVLRLIWGSVLRSLDQLYKYKKKKKSSSLS